MKFHHFRCVSVFAIVCLLTVVAQGQTTIYVDDDAATGGDGLSWATAYDDLQLALDAAKAPGSTVDEIRVAGGIYKPSVRAEPNLSRTKTFQLINGVAIRGGYRGCPGGDCGSGDPDERDIALYKTILSGDLNGDDEPDFVNNNENCYHVFYHSEELGLDETAVLDGCTITAGNANGGSGHDDGGAMYNDGCSPTIIDCTIIRNAAYEDSGGVCCEHGSSPRISNCTISENTGEFSGGVYCEDNSNPSIINCTISGNIAVWGAGVVCYNNSSPTLRNCTISRNTATYAGGSGVYCYLNCSPLIENCTISGNTARSLPDELVGGGGVYCLEGSNPTITNCTISGNVANWGGGVFCETGSNPTIIHCTITANTAFINGGGVTCCSFSNPTITNCSISKNTAGDGGGVYSGDFSSPTITNCTITENTAGPFAGIGNGGGVYCDGGTQTLTNCILWGNRAQSDGPEIYLKYSSSTLTISHSDVEGGEGAVWVDTGATLNWGPGNISADPLLIRDGTHLQAESPCLEAGDPAGDYTGKTDIDGESRVINELVDMGADEFLDSDGDGLPDWWEMFYFGSATAGDPSVDDDGDGRSNLEEYRLSTHPLMPPATFYVDLSGSDSWDGLSAAWDGTHGPKATIQAAIDATGMHEGDEVVVADGTYMGVGNRDLDFGGREITLRSAGGPAACVIDCEGQGRGFNFHTGETTLSAIDGFTITGGFTRYGGGGVNCYGSSPTITNCTIESNTVEFVGGGGINCYCSSSTIYNCVIANNTAMGYGKGGGIRCTSSSYLTIIDCTIVNNRARGAGGIMFSGDLTIDNCTIMNNSADYDGGGFYSSGTHTFTNCVVSNNTAGRDGGALYCTSSSQLTLTNCTIKNNVADHAGGGVYCDRYSVPMLTNCTISGNSAIYTGGVYCSWFSSPTITNCIIWGDIPYGLEIKSEDEAMIAYSNIEGGWEGEGNIDADPLFVQYPDDGGDGWGDDPDTPDVDEGANDIFGDLHLTSFSPCIDAGDPASDFGLEPEPDGGRVNMGAYGNTPEATSKAGLGITGYGLVSRTRVGRTVFAYELTVTVHNSSDSDVSDVVLTLLDMPDNVMIGSESGEDTVDIGPIAAGATVTSTDTFKIIVDRTVPVSSLAISWNVAYTVDGESSEFIFTAPLSRDDLDGEPDPGDDDEFDVNERFEEVGKRPTGISVEESSDSGGRRATKQSRPAAGGKTRTL